MQKLCGRATLPSRWKARPDAHCCIPDERYPLFSHRRFPRNFEIRYDAAAF